MRLLKKHYLLLVSGGVFVTALSVHFWHRPSSSPSVKTDPFVSVERAVRQKISVKVSFPGTVSALDVVQIRPRIDGQILKVHFKEGDLVEKGQLLFTLDDDLLQTQVREAEGAVHRDRGNLTYAEAEVRRNEALEKRNITSDSKFEQAIATAESARGALVISQSILDRYKIQIGYTRIESPLDGRIGFQQVDTGNIVRVNDTQPLAAIMRVDPIQVRFALPEKYLTALQKKDITKVQVDLKFLDKTLYSHKGFLSVLDNQVDPETGTLIVKARFPNPDSLLIPGQYVTLEFSLSGDQEAVVIPLKAVQIGQDSSYVYVYDPETHVVRYRPVSVTPLSPHLARVDGNHIPEGTWVVTAGHLKIKDTLKVRVAPSAQELTPSQRSAGS